MRETIKLCCLVALTIVGCAVGLRLNGFIGHADELVTYTRERSVYTFDTTNGILRETKQTLDEFRKAVTTWQNASEVQSKSATAVLGSVQATSVSLQTLVKRTDASLNDSVLPNLAASVNAQNQSLLQSQAQLRDGLTQLQKTLADADSQINNPAIGQSLASIAAGTDSLADSAKHLDGVATDAKNLADYEVKQLETPEKVWLSVLKFVLGYGASARGLFIGYK